uniref:CN hydrolase domain-containing protein n=1 Tax=Ananas comosus var. bracteatus TaxID=296719 RepID=A0A6V7P967_ANACO|nr:unnamed protein product [Ananas comosus var. bracteatus]
MLYRSRGAHLICYPGAFNMSTGELLWELMQRSSCGIDHLLILFHMQLFVATCSPARNPNAESDYMIWGHSSLVGPVMNEICCCEVWRYDRNNRHDEATVVGEIDYSMIHRRRENLSLAVQRCGVIYKTVDVLGQIA